MPRSHFRTICLSLTAAALFGCQSELAPEATEITTEEVQTSEAVEPADTETPQTEVVEAVTSEKNTERPQSTVAASSAKPETYCYQMRSDMINEDAIITIDPQNRVIGRMIGTSYGSDQVRYTDIEGVVKNGIVYADTFFEGRTDKLEWPFDPQAMFLNEEMSLQAANCGQVNIAFQEADGSEAVALATSGDSVRMNRVEFDAGKSSTTVSDSAVRGERIVYELDAGAGQRMTLSISAVEDNAAFDVVDPSGVVLGTELQEKSFVLPHAGNYQVIVGGTRGNATYDLDIEIR